MLGNWLVRAVSAASDRRSGGGGRSPREKQEGRQQEGGREGARVVNDGRKKANSGGGGAAMAGKEEGRAGLGYEMCTRLSAPGVPCGPGSGVRGGVRRSGMKKRNRRKRRRRRGRGRRAAAYASNCRRRFATRHVRQQRSNQIHHRPSPSCFHIGQTWRGGGRGGLMGRVT